MKRRDFMTSLMASGLAAPALAQGLDAPPEFRPLAPLPAEVPPAPEALTGAAPETPPQTASAPPPSGTRLTETGEVIGDLRYRIPAEMHPKRVPVETIIPEGEIHIAPSSYALYFGLGNQMAIRYRCGIGEEGRYRAGEFRIARKVKWPSWTPTRNMVRRNPERYGQYASGMRGGPENPLGARALYLHYFGGGDTYLRIHGTPQPWTVLSASSSGCVRMINAHVIDLFNRAPIGTRVKLYEKMDNYDPTL